MADREFPPPRPSYASTPDAAWQPPAGVPVLPTAREPERVANFRFTGDGAEYFRIWVVNLLLTLVTLGVYSAWAKVRKTRYFWNNTRLDGHAFDFHGRPVAILIGRMLALSLLVAYSIAFDISATAGLVVVIVLCLVGPWLFMRAQRFKLVNSSWRGLRFGFDRRVSEAYRAVLPPLVIWFSGAILAVLASGQMGPVAAAGSFSVMLFPWMHHRLKAYQHRGARYGDRRFDFLSATGAFYRTYFKAALLGALGGAAALLVMGIGSVLGTSGIGPVVTIVVAAIVGVLVYGSTWPYFYARLQAIVWSHTRLADVRFATSIAVLPLAKLLLKNGLLTLVTAGLYWPFAAIALARYRVECMRVQSDVPIGVLADAAQAAPGFAGGDAALDAFGLDIGL